MTSLLKPSLVVPFLLLLACVNIAFSSDSNRHIVHLFVAHLHSCKSIHSLEILIIHYATSCCTVAGYESRGIPYIHGYDRFSNQNFNLLRFSLTSVIFWAKETIQYIKRGWFSKAALTGLGWPSCKGLLIFFSISLLLLVLKFGDNLKISGKRKGRKLEKRETRTFAVLSEAVMMPSESNVF